MDTLRDAVFADPFDRSARQVYADRLLEDEDPRGRFIQLQCRGAEDDVLWKLWHTWEKRWLGPLRPVVRSSEFTGGFPSRVVLCRNGRALADAHALPDRATLTDVDTQGSTEGLALALTLPHVQAVRGIRDRADVLALLRGPPRAWTHLGLLRNLTHRAPFDASLDFEMAAALKRLPDVFPDLERLDLADRASFDVVQPLLSGLSIRTLGTRSATGLPDDLPEGIETVALDIRRDRSVTWQVVVDRAQRRVRVHRIGREPNPPRHLLHALDRSLGVHRPTSVSVFDGCPWTRPPDEVGRKRLIWVLRQHDCVARIDLPSHWPSMDGTAATTFWGPTVAW